MHCPGESPGSVRASKIAQSASATLCQSCEVVLLPCPRSVQGMGLYWNMAAVAGMSWHMAAAASSVLHL